MDSLHNTSLIKYYAHDAEKDPWIILSALRSWIFPLKQPKIHGLKWNWKVWILICHDCTAKHPTRYKLPAFYRYSLFEDKGNFFRWCCLWRLMFPSHYASEDIFCRDAFGDSLIWYWHALCQPSSGGKTCLKTWIQPPPCWLIQAGLNPGKSFETFTCASCDRCQSHFVLCFMSFPTSTTESVALSARRHKWMNEWNRLEMPSRKKAQNMSMIKRHSWGIEENTGLLLPVLGLKANSFYQRENTHIYTKDQKPHVYTHTHPCTQCHSETHIFLSQPASPKAARNESHLVCPAAVFPLDLM